MTLVRGTTDRLRLRWEIGHCADGPDGSRYMIQTANPLHESPYSWALVRRSDEQSMSTLLTSNRGCPYGDELTIRGAKKVCEWDAWDRAGRPS